MHAKELQNGTCANNNLVSVCQCVVTGSQIQYNKHTPMKTCHNTMFVLCAEKKVYQADIPKIIMSP